MDIRVWHHDDAVLTEAEIEDEARICKEVRAELEEGRLTKLIYSILDRAYLRSLRKGKPIVEARADAQSAASFAGGILIGAFITLIVVGTIAWMTSLVQTANAVNVVVILVGWTFLMAVSINWTRKQIVRPFRWLIGRLRKEKK